MLSFYFVSTFFLPPFFCRRLRLIGLPCFSFYHLQNILPVRMLVCIAMQTPGRCSRSGFVFLPVRVLPITLIRDVFRWHKNATVSADFLLLKTANFRLLHTVRSECCGTIAPAAYHSILIFLYFFANFLPYRVYPPFSSSVTWFAVPSYNSHNSSENIGWFMNAA